MNKDRLTELLKESDVSELANIFNEIFNLFDWLMDYVGDTLEIDVIEQDDTETDEEFEDRIKDTEYGISSSFCRKCYPENTSKIINIALEKDKVVEFWELFLGDEYISDFEDFVDTFHNDRIGRQNLSEKQLEIVKEVIDILRRE